MSILFRRTISNVQIHRDFRPFWNCCFRLNLFINIYIVLLCCHIGFPDSFPKNRSGRVGSRERMFTFSPSIANRENLRFTNFTNPESLLNSLLKYENEFSQVCTIKVFNVPAGFFAIAWALAANAILDFSQVRLSETFALQFRMNWNRKFRLAIDNSGFPLFCFMPQRV